MLYLYLAGLILSLIAFVGFGILARKNQDRNIVFAPFVILYILSALWFIYFINALIKML